MRATLTPNDIANKIRMMQTQYFGSFLIVEGPTDERFFSVFVNADHCRIVPANGKEQAIITLNILEKAKSKGVLCIVDADFWHVESVKPYSQNLYVTDTHDLETLILASPAFDKLVSELMTESKQKIYKKKLLGLLLKSGVVIGYLRWLSSKSRLNLNLKFKGISCEQFIDKKTLSISVRRLIREVKKNSAKPQISEKKLRKGIVKIGRGKHDPWLICSGHDLIEILVIGFHHIFGARRAKTLDSDQVEAFLRMSYDSRYFQSTKIYASIKDWEKQNKPFVILDSI